MVPPTSTVTTDELAQLSRLIRYFILTATTAAGSGHVTSSLSAVELMVGLMFSGQFMFDLNQPQHPNNDRLIFSKGHASPLFYALYAAAGAISFEELQTLRQFGSNLEGHPTNRFEFTEVATGSLGQGLSVGAGFAINGKHLDKLPYRTYVLLGDSEMAEGSNWEAMQLAAHYQLNNLTGIIDVNRLGQRGETMYGHDLSSYEKKIAAFGWQPLVIDGHNLDEIIQAYTTAQTSEKPSMIIARTIKGKGVSFLEDQENWHGKVLTTDQLTAAVEELGSFDPNIRGKLQLPEQLFPPEKTHSKQPVELDSKNDYHQPLAPRKAYGHALVEQAELHPQLVVLDAEVSNSTFAETFAKHHPDRFFEMFIAEQNMVGVALGLSKRGKIPFVSTFASFFTRAVDQIRVSQYSDANLNFVGSHVGVSIGQDGPTQMGLEDIALFRSILDSVVLSPADHVATEKLVAAMIDHPGICYLRATRADTEPVYQPDESFEIGGSKTLRSSDQDCITVLATGITLYEALAAHETLKKEDVHIRVIDVYSIKPLDVLALTKAAQETGAIITVEDHFAEGGLGEAVASALAFEKTVPIYSLAVRKMPRSGEPDELMAYEEIDRSAIIKLVKEILP